MSLMLSRGHNLVRNVKSVIIPIQSRLVHNYDDYKPGKKPATKAEAEAAARKYGLLPQEYEPYDDSDGLGYGDYPKLPDVATETRDPFYPWDQPEFKRNFGEPWHQQFDLYSEDRYNISLKPPQSKLGMFLTFSGVMAAFISLFCLANYIKFNHPRLEKQLPQSGVTHYTFEPAE